MEILNYNKKIKKARIVILVIVLIVILILHFFNKL